MISALLRACLPGHERELDLSSGDLAEVSSSILRSGLAPLVWWRLKDTHFAQTECVAEFKQAYRLSRLSVQVHEQGIRQVFNRFRAAGIEPVVVKGWAIARHYPDAALRPYGDIDLCVRPDQFRQAQALLDELAASEGHYVDLHQGFDYIGAGNVESRGQRSEVGDQNRLRIANRESRNRNQKAVAGHRSSVAVARWEEVFARTQLVPCGEVMIRVLSEADHLRVLCQHFLRSGAWRPLWLVDVAVTIANCETRIANRGLRIAKQEQRRNANWVMCVVALAQQLLGAEVRGQRSEVRQRESGIRVKGLGDSDRPLEDSLKSLEVRENNHWPTGPVGQRLEVREKAGSMVELGSGHRTEAVDHFYAQTPNPYNLSGGNQQSTADLPLTSRLLPLAIRDSQFAIPGWLKPAVLRQWGRCQNPSTLKPTLPVLVELRSQPRALLREIYARWDHPIRSTAELDRRFNRWPRAPYQVVDQLRRLRAELPKQIGSVVRDLSNRQRVEAKTFRRVAAMRR